MASPTPPPVETPSTEGAAVLERLGAQIASLAAQVTEIDHRMTSVESGSPSRPVEVQLSPETVAQIVETLAELQAAGTQALDDVFKSATDDLTEALSGLVRAEISRSLSDAGYSVDVIEAVEPDIALEPFPASTGATAGTVEVEADEDDQAEEDLIGQDLPDVESVAASVRSGPEPAAMPSIVTPLAASSAGVAGRTEAAPESIDAASIREASSGFGDDDVDDDDVDDLVVDADRPPLALAELDDPFLDALIRKEPLSA
ncbi:hypothetical protein [Candidatus Poriferisodalis sp.]|uniref:hypothetical protein n=1 Tax=Candidatus Poriferisodalis sp. TaxID=3101277 RepID=UPI003B59AF59